MAYTYDQGNTVQSFLDSLRNMPIYGDQTAEVPQYQSFNSMGITDLSQMLATPMPFAGGQTAAQNLLQFGVTDPLNQLDMKLPDALPGSLMPSGNDLGGVLLALAPLAAMVGGFAGVGGLSNAAGSGLSGLGGSVEGFAPELGFEGYGGTSVSGGLGGGYVPGISDLSASGGSGLDNLLQFAGDGGEELAWDPLGADADYLQNWLAQGAAEGGTTFSPSLLSNIAKLFGGSGTGSSSDLLSALVRALPGLAGAYASNQQTNAITDLANKYSEMGAPYRSRLTDLYANPSGFLSSPEVRVPVQQGTDALARSLSAKVGNPIDNMTALQEIQNYSANQLFGRLGQEKDRLAGFGGLANYNAAAPGLEQNAIGSNSNMWNALGSAASSVFNPQPSTLEQLMKSLQGSGIFKVA